MQIASTSGLPQVYTTSKRQSQYSNSAGLLKTFPKPPGYTTSNIEISPSNSSPSLQTPMTNFSWVRCTHGHVILTMSRAELVLTPLRQLPSMLTLSWFPEPPCTQAIYPRHWAVSSQTPLSLPASFLSLPLCLGLIPQQFGCLPGLPFSSSPLQSFLHTVALSF